ncbi:MAG: OmpA family protein [Desulfobacteraceae bacterium]|nr:OmpA family protein [Desulfobacteraceae bacterium]
MFRRLFSVSLILMMMGLLAACATAPPMTTEPFQAAQLDSSAFVSSVDTFVILMDASSSMAEKYQDMYKISLAKKIVSGINATLPPIDANAALVVFGSGECLNKQHALALFGPAPYNQSEMAAGLDSLKCVGGTSPMYDGTELAGQKLQESLGKTALVVVSDGEDINQENVMKSVQALKDAMGDRLCIYTVQVGDDAKGTRLMKSVAEVGGCGFAVNADEITDPDAMADFVTKVFLAPAPVVVVTPLDSDGDGVPDDIDQCPGTPTGAKVNDVGCWLMAGDTVLFDFDSATINDTTLLEAALVILKDNPEMTGEVRGFTCSIGPEAYNQMLSEKRANAVRDWFIQNGIAAERIRAVGYGETNPIASNDTEEGRRKNRRVELHPDL